MSVFSKLGSGVAIFAASALVLSGCAASDDAPAPETTEETGGTSMPAETIQLTVGTALPVTGNLAFLGPPEEAGVMLAAADINEANMGLEIEVIYGDSGDPDNRAYETEIPRLLAADVSAVIGAAASGVSMQFIDQLVFDAEVLMFSPANTSPAFTAKDTNGLYFRAAPSDALQGQVLGDELADDGHEGISMIVLNDAYGIGLADAVEARFVSNGGQVLERPTFNAGDTNFASQIATITGSNPDAVVVITFDEANTILPDLLNTFDAEQLYLVDGNLADYSDVLAAGALEGAKGTAPGSKDDPVELVNRADAVWQAAGNDPLDSNLYLAESYDATMAIALAALMAQSTDSRAIADALPAVSGTNGGDVCFTFTECAELIFAGASAITFSGGTGPMAFDENGDRTTATINMFRYDANNQIGDPIAQFSF
jgi:branched-chain amino acid transport system substrate-binding protein